MHSQHATDSDSIETAVVDQAPNRFGVDAQLIRHVTDADEIRLSVSGRHRNPTYSRKRRIAASSSRAETEPSNFALILPSRPTRNVQGSPGRCPSRTQGFGPRAGLFWS